MIFDPFTVVPACPVTYSYSVSPATDLVGLDASTRTLSFFEATDLTKTSTTGPNYYQVYTVTLTAQSGALTKQQSFDLQVKNPCVDSSLSSIAKPANEVHSYQINDPAFEVDLKALAFSSSLPICGDITWILTGVQNALSYD